jgi:hypothetical protein
MVFVASHSYPATIEIYPTNSFASAVGGLNPGDTLVVHAGTYNETSRVSISVKGNAANPVVVMGAPGEAKPVITSTSGNDTINIEGATYLTLKGLEITNTGDFGINIKSLNGDASHITIDGLKIHALDIGINTNYNVTNLTVKNTEIYHTGKGSGTGEGMYIGCMSGCAVSNSTFENNWVHDALPGASQGDGIEIKPGSHSNIVRNNVVYNMPYPCIFVYGGGSGVNTVEGNVMWNCSDAGVQVGADAIIRNNIIFNSSWGISAVPNAIPAMRNVTIANNSLYNNDEGIHLTWGSATNMVLANNAIYSAGKTAVSGSLGGNTASKNYVEGSMSGVSVDGVKFIGGGSFANAFVDAANRDFWPKTGSVLRGNADSSFAPALDFNLHPRVSPYDVGAYETDGAASNPGWKIVPGFKNTGADPIAPRAPTNLRRLN